MEDQVNAPCNCTNCPGQGCTCGCQSAAPATCQCGPGCACGPACACKATAQAGA